MAIRAGRRERLPFPRDHHAAEMPMGLPTSAPAERMRSLSLLGAAPCDPLRCPDCHTSRATETRRPVKPLSRSARRPLVRGPCPQEHTPHPDDAGRQAGPPPSARHAFGPPRSVSPQGCCSTSARREIRSSRTSIRNASIGSVVRTAKTRERLERAGRRARPKSARNETAQDGSRSSNISRGRSPRMADPKSTTPTSITSDRPTRRCATRPRSLIFVRIAWWRREAAISATSPHPQGVEGKDSDVCPVDGNRDRER